MKVGLMYHFLIQFLMGFVILIFLDGLPQLKDMGFIVSLYLLLG